MAKYLLFAKNIGRKLDYSLPPRQFIDNQVQELSTGCDLSRDDATPTKISKMLNLTCPTTTFVTPNRIPVPSPMAPSFTQCVRFSL